MPKTDVKYRMTSFIAVASGAEISGENSAEYALTFHADGKADFVMAGAPVAGLPWTADGDTITVDYFGNKMQCTMEDGLLKLDFFGSMLMKMAPQE